MIDIELWLLWQPPDDVDHGPGTVACVAFGRSREMVFMRPSLARRSTATCAAEGAMTRRLRRSFVLPAARILSVAATVAVLAPMSYAAADSAPASDSGPAVSATLAQHIPVGNGVNLGGFSDLYPRDGSGRHFWTITDRGPNFDRDTGQGFVDPKFTPRILAIDVKGSKLTVSKQILLHLPRGVTDPVTGGSNITGLPNISTDTAAFDPAGNQLPFDPYGVDSEGVVRAPNGSFWISDEYRPSVLHIAADGTVLSRLVPSDQTAYSAKGIDVQRILPAVLSKEKSNRGIEALTISADGRTLYAGMQSPLNNPTTKISAASRNMRIVQLDISHAAKPRLAAEYLTVRDADNSTDGDWKNSTMSWLAPGQLLVEERDAKAPAKHTYFYAVDLRQASNLLGTKWDDPATSPSLEQLDPPGLAANDVVAGAKRLVLDVAAAGTTNSKLEGVAVLRQGRRTEIAVVDDNDFDVSGIDASGNVQFTTTPEQLDIYRLPTAQVYN